MTTALPEEIVAVSYLIESQYRAMLHIAAFADFEYDPRPQIRRLSYNPDGSPDASSADVSLSLFRRGIEPPFRDSYCTGAKELYKCVGCDRVQFEGEIMHRSHVLTFVLSSATAVGCADGTPRPSQDGLKFILDAEPPGAQSIVEMKSAAESGETEGIVVVGRIGAGENETWDTAKAAFMVSDLSLNPASSAGHGGDHDNCKFCQEKKRQELEKMALFQIVDENGQVVSTDARKLLGLQKNQVIVARGRGELDEVGNVVFSATRLYVRKYR